MLTSMYICDTIRATISPQFEQSLREKVKKILDAHVCEPSLVHGDLWSGNQAYTKEGDPVIFDPAVYVSAYACTVLYVCKCSSTYVCLYVSRYYVFK